MFEINIPFKKQTGDMVGKAKEFTSLFQGDVLSIDIGAYNIKFITGRYQKGVVRVGKAFLIPTPLQAFNDGKISDIQKLALIMREALKENGVNIKKVILTVNSSSTIIREIMLPSVKENEMDGMVRFEIEQYLPVSIDEYDVEYKLIEEVDNDSGKKSGVMVVAAPRSIVEGYISLVKEIGLTPLAIDINSNAVSKLFETQININGEDYSSDKTVAIIDIGYNTLNVNIIFKGQVRFNRLLPRGGRELDSGLVSALGISVEEAVSRKTGKYVLTVAQEYVSAAEKMSDPIGFAVDSWVQDIGRTFQYYSSRSEKNGIDRVYLMGGSSNLNGLAEYLSLSLNLPVEKITSLGNIIPGKEAAGIETVYYLNAAGAMIRK